MTRSDGIEKLLILIHKKRNWDELPVFCFTTDVDWASEDVMEKYFEAINPLEIRPTLFVTHESKSIDTNHQAGHIERGIHPNFLSGSSHGSNFREVIETCRAFAPEAYGFRSHRCFEVTDITHMLKNEYGYKYVSNLCTILQPAVRPVLHESGLVHFPIFFEDGTHLYNGMNMNFETYVEYFAAPGLKVISFHPMNLIFNSPSLAYMRSIKDTLSREEYNSITAATIEKMRNRKIGIAHMILGIIEFVKKNGYPIVTMNELCEKTLGHDNA